MILLRKHQGLYYRYCSRHMTRGARFDEFERAGIFCSVARTKSQVIIIIELGDDYCEYIIFLFLREDNSFLISVLKNLPSTCHIL